MGAIWAVTQTEKGEIRGVSYETIAGGQKLAIHLANDGAVQATDGAEQEVGFMAGDARVLPTGELAT